MITIQGAVQSLRSIWRGIVPALSAAESSASLLARQDIDRLQREELADPKRIGGYGFRAYSQNDEDGILQEIFRRIGTTNRKFIEFGCGDGLENNSVYLLLSGWRGVWIDGSSEDVASARKAHSQAIQEGRLAVECQMLNAETIDRTLAGLSPGEVDLLSIDIDGNDYWVWRAISSVSARVVVIEYNATFRPPISLVQEYGPDAQWNGTNFFGASLSALKELGEAKGYALVGSNIAGQNAFFVRADLLGDHFSSPYTAENHYTSPHYDLFPLSERQSHPRGTGKYVVPDPKV